MMILMKMLLQILSSASLSFIHSLKVALFVAGKVVLSPYKHAKAQASRWLTGERLTSQVTMNMKLAITHTNVDR